MSDVASEQSTTTDDASAEVVTINPADSIKDDSVLDLNRWVRVKKSGEQIVKLVVSLTTQQSKAIGNMAAFSMRARMCVTRADGYPDFSASRDAYKYLVRPTIAEWLEGLDDNEKRKVDNAISQRVKRVFRHPAMVEWYCENRPGNIDKPTVDKVLATNPGTVARKKVLDEICASPSPRVKKAIQAIYTADKGLGVCPEPFAPGKPVTGGPEHGDEQAPAQATLSAAADVIESGGIGVEGVTFAVQAMVRQLRGSLRVLLTHPDAVEGITNRPELLEGLRVLQGLSGTGLAWLDGELSPSDLDTFRASLDVADVEADEADAAATQAEKDDASDKDEAAIAG